MSESILVIAFKAGLTIVFAVGESTIYMKPALPYKVTISEWVLGPHTQLEESEGPGLTGNRSLTVSW